MIHSPNQETTKVKREINSTQSIIRESHKHLRDSPNAKQTRITVLVENNKDQMLTDIKISHGISLFVERKGLKFLLDLGDKDIYYSNSKKLNKNIKEVDFVFISHGHNDHGGGLKHFLKHNQKARIYIKENAIKEKHFSKRKRFYKDRSISNSLLKKHPDRFFFIESLTELDQGIFIIPEIIQKYPLPVANNSLFKKTKTKIVQDDFDHEQLLVIQDNDGLIIFSGCNHKGILNVMETVNHYFKKDPIKAVIGGFHLFNPALGIMAETPEAVIAIGSKMNEYRVKKYITGHCTGIEAYTILKSILKNRLIYFSAGISFVP